MKHEAAPEAEERCVPDEAHLVFQGLHSAHADQGLQAKGEECHLQDGEGPNKIRRSQIQMVKKEFQIGQI